MNAALAAPFGKDNLFFFLLDSALYALFSVHSNLHPLTEINYNHEYKMN